MSVPGSNLVAWMNVDMASPWECAPIAKSPQLALNDLSGSPPEVTIFIMTANVVSSIIGSLSPNPMETKRTCASKFHGRRRA